MNSCYVFCFLLLIVAFPGELTAATHAATIRSPSGAMIDVTAILPTGRRVPRAVVLALPGASGIGDLDLAFQLIAASSNGGTPARPFLPYALSARGYAYIYFNYGGILSRQRCIDPALPSQRLQKFLNQCLDRKFNRKRGFSTTDGEIASVRNWLETVPAFKNLPVILLAFSEGGQHAARLLRTGRMKVDGFVGVGTPTVSPAENVLSQMNRKLKYRRIRDFLDHERSEVLRTVDLPRVFKDDEALKYLQRSLRAQPAWTRAELAVAEEFEVDLSTQAFKDAWKANGTKPMTSEFFGVEIEGFSSSDFIQEQLDDTNNMVQSLARFEGKSTFIFGEYDSVVDFSAASACGAIPRPTCRLTIVPNLGHVFMLPEDQLLGLDPILQAIDDVL